MGSILVLNERLRSKFSFLEGIAKLKILQISEIGPKHVRKSGIFAKIIWKVMSKNRATPSHRELFIADELMIIISIFREIFCIMRFSGKFGNVKILFW